MKHQVQNDNDDNRRQHVRQGCAAGIGPASLSQRRSGDGTAADRRPHSLVAAENASREP